MPNSLHFIATLTQIDSDEKRKQYIMLEKYDEHHRGIRPRKTTS